MLQNLVAYFVLLEDVFSIDDSLNRMNLLEHHSLLLNNPQALLQLGLYQTMNEHPILVSFRFGYDSFQALHMGVYVLLLMLESHPFQPSFGD